MNLDLLNSTLKQREVPTYPHIIKYKPNRFFTEYDRGTVKRLLDKFLDTKGLCKEWSSKRGGWVIRCPGAGYHEHRERRDDCTLSTYEKGNGFVFIKGRCRHNSCSGELMAFCKALNQEWGVYLNANYQP